MIPAAAIGLWAVVMAGLGLSLQIRARGGWASVRQAVTGQPACPSCRVSMHAVPDREFSQRAYRVWACLRCTNTIAETPDGQLAACGTCRQHTLLTTLWRLPSGAAGEPRVDIHERCPVCDHAATVTLPEPERPISLGQVIPFPGARDG